MAFKDLIDRALGKESKPPAKERKPLSDIAKRFLDSVSTTSLIKYQPTSRFERVVEGIVDALQSQGQHVLLVSPSTRGSIYAERFGDSIQSGDVTLVKISASGRTDRFYKIEGKKEEKGADRIVEISIDWLEYLSEIIEDLSEKSSVVFEPLTDIILINGFDKTFKFIKKTVDFCVDSNIRLICLINDEAHGETVKAGFEGLFMNIAKIMDDEIQLVK